MLKHLKIRFRDYIRAMKLFRWIAILEGISYLVLLGICMPLKYIFDIPEPTYPVGLAHGILFVAYCSLVVLWAYRLKWPVKQTFFALGASLLPIAPFIVERKLLRDIKED